MSAMGQYSISQMLERTLVSLVSIHRKVNTQHQFQQQTLATGRDAPLAPLITGMHPPDLMCLRDAR